MNYLAIIVYRSPSYDYSCEHRTASSMTASTTKEASWLDDAGQLDDSHVLAIRKRQKAHVDASSELGTSVGAVSNC